MLTAVGIIGIVLLIIGVLMLIGAVIWMIINATKGKGQPWYLWVMLVVALILLLVGAIMVYAGIKKKRSMARLAKTKVKTLDGEEVKETVTTTTYKPPQIPASDALATL